MVGSRFRLARTDKARECKEPLLGRLLLGLLLLVLLVVTAKPAMAAVFRTMMENVATAAVVVAAEEVGHRHDRESAIQWMLGMTGFAGAVELLVKPDS